TSSGSSRTNGTSPRSRTPCVNPLAATAPPRSRRRGARQAASIIRALGVSVGTRLGPYEIVAPIGAGGMGEVYRAHDARLNRDVAVKILPAALSTDPERRERFEREARTVSSLNHPNICTVYDVGHQGEIDYLVMELLEGESLQQRLTKGPL